MEGFAFLEKELVPSGREGIEKAVANTTQLKYPSLQLGAAERKAWGSQSPGHTGKRAATKTFQVPLEELEFEFWDKMKEILRKIPN